MTHHRTPRRTGLTAALIIGALAVGGLAGGWALEHARGPEYQARTNVLVQFWAIQGFLLTGQSPPVSAQDVADAATLATSPDVLDLAATRLADGRDGTQLASVVTATPQPGSNGFSIQATGTTAEGARRASQQVAAMTAAVLQRRIESTSGSLTAVAQGDLVAAIQQRAQVLTTSIQPLQVLQTSAPVQTAPSITAPLMLGVVGLAAGVLVVIALVYARPVVRRPRDAQRLTELPAVVFRAAGGGSDAARLLRRLLDDRPKGKVLVVPVDAESEKEAARFADWARARAAEGPESERIVATAEPVGLVLDPRPAPGRVAAVVLVCPPGVATRALVDAVALLRSWSPADLVLIPT